jgi:hypothetical protein
MNATTTRYCVEMEFRSDRGTRCTLYSDQPDRDAALARLGQVDRGPTPIQLNGRTEAGRWLWARAIAYRAAGWPTPTAFLRADDAEVLGSFGDCPPLGAWSNRKREGAAP